MADGILDPDLVSTLAQARTAIERGEYGLSLRLLEPLAEQHRPVSAIGAGVRLLMATALMGMGESERATACCRSLQGCSDPTLRARARELLMVLEAPALRRPRDWSLTLPPLGSGLSLEGTGTNPLRPRRRRQEAPPPPPVGETRSPVGFAALVGVLLALLLLASLLGGCLEVRSELTFAGPGRLQLRHGLHSSSGRITPWQERFAQTLHQAPVPFQRQEGPDGLTLATPVLPAERVLQAFSLSVQEAAALAAIELPPPALRLQETNLLLGVRQRLSLDLDLRGLDPLPALRLELQLAPVSARAVREASPRPAVAFPGRRGQSPRLIWPLQAGQINHLVISCWRWSPLGIGAVLIAAALGLVLLLQRLRLQLGFGLPQLPA
ncbi:MAG: DUF3153 domain-containing protein [Cyanobium sp.]